MKTTTNRAALVLAIDSARNEPRRLRMAALTS
jgi:hypothetical protein